MSVTEQHRRNVPEPTTANDLIGDRRVRRTRKLLHEAFLELILEQGYPKTTVQDILDRADVGRSTFYAHFRDKEALLTASFDGIRDHLEHELTDVHSADPLDVSRPAQLLYEHAYRNQHVYRALCGRQGGQLVQRYLRELLTELLRAHLPARFRGVPAEVAAEFYASSALGLLVWWIEQDFHKSPAWLTANYRKLAAPSAE